MIYILLFSLSFDNKLRVDSVRKVDRIKYIKARKEKQAESEIIRRIKHEHDDSVIRTGLQSSIVIENDEDLVKCNKSNVILKKRRCMCLPGYYSNNSLEYGCWSCYPACNKFAVCTTSNICRCIEGFEGDGFKCKAKQVEPISLSPQRCVDPFRCRINITLEKSQINFPRSLFCKFDSVITQAERINADTISCRVPQSKNELIKVSVSLDGTIWSQQDLILQVIPVDNGHNFTIWPMIYLLILLVIISVILYKKWHKNRKTEREFLFPSRSMQK